MLIKAFVGMTVALAVVVANAERATAVILPLSPVIYNPGNGHRYQLLSAATWEQSQAAAESLGGNLATIRNQAEQDFVFNTFGGFDGTQHLLWIGLYNPTLTPGGGEQDFVWVDGSPVTYTNWDVNEPNNAFGTEFWVAMYYPNYHNPGSWNDWSNQYFDPIGIPICGVVEFVPEPGSLLLAVAGAMGSICWWWRRRWVRSRRCQKAARPCQ